MSWKQTPYRLRRVPILLPLIFITASSFIGLTWLHLRSIIPSSDLFINDKTIGFPHIEDIIANTTIPETKKLSKKCATVEEMGEIFSRGYVEESLRVRRIVRDHFIVNGAASVRELPPDQFCQHGFVFGKTSEAGFGNEMYKILTAGALSVMLNRSLIIGQTRDKYPFGDYISYSNLTFTSKEVKHLWRKNRCLTKYGKHLIMRIDDFLKPARTNVLCSNWREWQQPVIWFQNTTDSIAAQFFLKNIHPEMREAASDLFGMPENIQFRANVFGELMRILVSPSTNVELAVNWALKGGADPDVALHMRMQMNRPERAGRAALDCIRKAVHDMPISSRPKVLVVSDNPDLVKDMRPSLEEFAEVLHFDYSQFEGNITDDTSKLNLNFRVKDWGSAPRWVAFVDFFLASRAKHAIISGAHRRVGTTFVQLFAALAAAYRLDENASTNSSITLLSSFQSNLLLEGLRNQVGWGHVWNRFAGPLSCHNQPTQCAITPVLPPAWWDGIWQSPISRDIQRMGAYGIKLSGLGTIDDQHLKQVCSSKKDSVVAVQFT